MPKFYPSLSSDLAEWLLAQPLFFVASAPLTGAHINLSPKGHPSHSLAVINQNQVAYLDATGSGCETIAHIYENGRVTLMTCSFGASPRIMRLFCTGRVVEKGNPKFADWIATTGIKEGIKACRAVIVLDIFKVQTSCGYGVPVLSPKNSASSRDDDPESDAAVAAAAASCYWEDRDTMPNWAAKMLAKDSNAIQIYQRQNNMHSLDGCPGLRSVRAAGGEVLVLGDVRAGVKKMVGGQWGAVVVGMVLMFLVMAVARALGVVEVRVVV